MAHPITQAVGGDFWGSKIIEVKQITAVTLSSHVNAVVGNANTIITRPSFESEHHSHRFIAFMVMSDGFYVRAGRFPNLTFVDGDVDVALNQITDTAHGHLPGAGPYHLGTSGTLPEGLDSTTNYHVGVIDDDTISLHLTHNAAHRLLNPVDITAAAGGGTHTYATMKAAMPSETNSLGDESIHLAAESGKGGGLSVIYAMPQFMTVVGASGNSKMVYWSLP